MYQIYATSKLKKQLIVKAPLLFFFLLVFSLSVYAEKSQGEQQQTPDASRQKELTYMVQQDCGSCHGMTLKGGLGPSLQVQRMSVLPKQYLMDAITHGRKDTPMPPWGPLLTQGEIQWIVEQLQAGLIKKP